MNNKNCRKLLGLLTFILFILLSTKTTKADSTYKTFTEDSKRGYVNTQDAYKPISSIEKVEGLQLKEPADIFIDSEDRVYIADTGNKRIIVTNKEGKLLQVIGEGILNAPTGVFVDDTKKVYVTDYGSSLVYEFAKDGKVLNKFGKPASPLFGKDKPYKPMKISVDKRGNLYIIGEGTTDGVIQLSSKGDFLGYFGINDSKFSLRIMLQRTFFNKEQRAKLFKNLPSSPNNVAIDAQGLIYTVTQGDEGKSIKRLNISGNNMLPKDMSYDPLFTDIFISKSSNLYAISQKGLIYEYDMEGNLIFVFGGRDDGKGRKGLFVNPTGIAVNSHSEIFVVDKERNNIQIFKSTEFADRVHKALELYKEGFYVDSEEPWRKVLQMNNLFDLAHKGLGESYYKQQRYDEALEQYMVANYRKGYSNAFWEIRNKWLQTNLASIFLWFIAIYAALKLIKLIHRKTGMLNKVIELKNRIKNIKILKELLYILYFLRHPIDGYYGIKKEKKTSILSATILYLLYFIVYIFSIYGTSFIFNGVEIREISLSNEAVKILAPFALWVISNYLVSTINDGEGKFSQVYMATIYSTVPYLIFKPIIIIVSNVLTLNEAFVLDFSGALITAWTLLLFFMMVREIHNYSFKETFKNIFLTLFCMLILMLVIFIVYVLLNQVFDFVFSIIQEVIVRAGQ